MWIVRDCAEFNNTDILHVSFIELSLSIIRGECRRISFYWLVLTLVERRKYFKVKLKTTWIVQRFAGRRRWPIPLFAFLGLRNAKPSPMIFWRLPPSLTPESVGINVKYAPTVKSRDSKTKGSVPFLAQTQFARAREECKNCLRRTSMVAEM